MVGPAVCRSVNGVMMRIHGNTSLHSTISLQGTWNTCETGPGHVIIALLVIGRSYNVEIMLFISINKAAYMI